MAILIDTNILLRSVQTHHPHYALVEHAFAVLRGRDEILQVSAQNFIEFWAVATRPLGSENGLGMTTDAVAKELGVLKDLFPLLPEPDAVFAQWEKLVTMYGVSGKNTHDAHIVATMRLNGINEILTFNVADFARYSEIRAIHPGTLNR